MNRKLSSFWTLTSLLVLLAIDSEPLLAQNLQVTATPSPSPGSIIVELLRINVVFSESVVGVDAADLLVNGVPASSVVTNNPNDYTFTVTQPADGAVDVTWADGHGIVANTLLATPFLGGLWTYVLDTNFAFSVNVVISEIMASNGTGILDEDGSRSDWIELRNLGPQQASLDGWYLTDTQADLTKWRFPIGMPPLQANSYLLVWASAKDRTNALAPLHTNFKLPSGGGFLALVSPTTNEVSSLAPYPSQVSDISFGRDQLDPSIVGYFTNSTPGKANAISGPGFLPDPFLSINSGVYTNDTLLMTLSAPSGTIRYTLNGTLPSTTSTLYTNSLTLSNSTLIKARVFPSPGTNLFPSAVVARNILFLDNTTRGFSSELPLVVISTQGQAVPNDVPPGGKRAEGTLCLIDTFQGRSSLQSTPDFIGSVGVEIFGQTSASFPKLPYRIEVHDELGNDLSIPIFGLPAESDWKLRNPFDDKTLLNDFLGYEIFEQMGHYSCRRRLVEVFVDSGGGRLKYPADYVGVETLFESIKQGANRVNIAKIPPTATNEPSITGGFVFAKDKDSPGDLNFSTQGGGGFPGEALKLHAPKPSELRPTPLASKLTPSGSNQLNYLVKYLNRMERAMYTNTWLAQTGTNHYSNYLDVDSFVDFHWLVEFSKQIDGVRLSSYFTKDRGGKLQAGPVWDWNLSFGNANYLRGGQTNGWYYSEQDQGMSANEHIWLRRLINGDASMGGPLPDGSGNAPGVGGDPDFNQKVSDRWSVLRTNILSATRLLSRIDDMSTMLNEATTRDLWGKYRSQIVGQYQWPNPDGTTADGRDIDYVHPTNYLGGTADSIIGQMKKFVLGRYLWIDDQFTRQPAISAVGGRVGNGFAFTVTPPVGATLYYTLDGTDPRSPGGAVASGALSNTSPASITVTANTRVFARAFQPGSWYGTWSGPSAVSFILETPPLRITEVLYHPENAPAGSTNTSSDFEFIEVKNIGTTPINLDRYSLTGGVSFVFPSLTLQAGARAVLVANSAAFSSRYTDPSIVIAGQYAGSLNKSGDRIALFGPLQEPIQDVVFNSSWYPATGGSGFAIAAVDETASGEASSTKASWRQGSVLGGTPGKSEPAVTPFPRVVVNEVLNHSVSPAVDRIELYNASAAAADISGWYLTDNLKSPKKFRIPAGTVIPAGGYRVFSESDFNIGLLAFSFSSLGEEVYLFSADAGGSLTGYAHGFAFGAQVDGASFGRSVTSDGQEHFVTQTAPTFGAINAGPKVGPVVISEIMYHPQDISKYGSPFDDAFGEYVELRNITSSTVSLFHPLFPTHSWTLRNAVSFVFPSNTSLPPLSSVLVVGFDPLNTTKLAAFRAGFRVPIEVPIFGPWNGQLPNRSGTVELAMPDQPVAAPSANAGLVPYVLVDGVSYADVPPWPMLADGLGASLHRLALDAFGDDPANWSAAAPSAGSSYSPGSAPILLQQPSDVTVVMTNTATATFSVTAGGIGPFSYQWLFNGVVIADETQATLILKNISLAKEGRYGAVVLNSSGVSLSTEATLTALQPVSILVQPRPIGGRPGTNAVLSVVAFSSSPTLYQWSFNGAPILGATSADLQVSDLKLSDDGQYQVRVSDSISSVLSDRVRLAVLVNPVFLVQPQSQSVIRGSSALLSVVVSNTTTVPLGFRWKKSGSIVLTQVTNSLVSYLVVSNIQVNLTYSVLVTNLALKSGTNSALAILTVVEDTDKDGMPDDYETLYPTFLNPNDASDASQDFDGDGMSNLSEYIAGTDPSDPKSYLKVDSIHVGGTGTQLELYARSNRSYTVEFRESVALGAWQTLTNIPAQSGSRVETIADPFPVSGGRIYRIATPVRTDRAIRTPVILQSPSSMSALQGTPVTLETAAYGLGDIQYQWRMNDIDIPGANAPFLSFASIQPADQARYSVWVTDDTGSVLTSPAALTVLQPPQIVAAPVSQTAHVGATVRFLVGATGSGALTYHWLFNSDPIPGANGPTLVLPSVTPANEGSYRVQISQSTDNGPVSVKTEPVDLTVLP